MVQRPSLQGLGLAGKSPPLRGTLGKPTFPTWPWEGAAPLTLWLSVGARLQHAGSGDAKGSKQKRRAPGWSGLGVVVLTYGSPAESSLFIYV